MSIERQIAEVYFDQDERVYRLVVEFFDDQTNIATIPVEFSGSADQTFSDIQRGAYEEASKTLRRILDKLV